MTVNRYLSFLGFISKRVQQWFLQREIPVDVELGYPHGPHANGHLLVYFPCMRSSYPCIGAYYNVIPSSYCGIVNSSLKNQLFKSYVGFDEFRKCIYIGIYLLAPGNCFLMYNN